MSTLLSQGAYGCVFYPGINCQGESYASKNFVTKLQRKGYSSQNEANISKKIRNIGDYQLFFVPIQTTCPIKLSSIGKKQLEECRVAQDTESDYIMMRMGYIESVPFFAYITNESDKKQFLFSNMISSFMHLLNGILKLTQINVVQFDLKSTNILYNVQNNLPLIIDFGISLDMSKFKPSEIKNYFYTYVPSYYVWPFDVHILCLVANKYIGTTSNITEADIVALAEGYVGFNKALEIFSDEFREKFKQKCLKYGKKFVGKSNDYIITTLTKEEVYKTWDNYALSILYLRFVSYLFARGFSKSKFLIEFTQVLLLNISPDPEERHTILQTITSINKFFNSTISADELVSLLATMDVEPIEVEKSITRDNLERIEHS